MNSGINQVPNLQYVAWISIQLKIIKIMRIRKEGKKMSVDAMT